MGYAQHLHMTKAEKEARNRNIEFDTLLKEMEDQLGCLIVSLQILRRSGPSKHVLQQIDGFGSDFTENLKRIMDMAIKDNPPRITRR